MTSWQQAVQCWGLVVGDAAPFETGCVRTIRRGMPGRNGDTRCAAGGTAGRYATPPRYCSPSLLLHLPRLPSPPPFFTARVEMRSRRFFLLFLFCRLG